MLDALSVGPRRETVDAQSATLDDAQLTNPFASYPQLYHFLSNNGHFFCSVTG